MKVSLAYVFPVVQIRKYFPLAARFTQTYHQFPAGCDHELNILCNGREPSTNEKLLFDGIKCRFYTYDNTGWDIGAFQRFADISDSDLLVCLGAYDNFHRSGWLARMVDEYLKIGTGLFGCTCYGGPVVHVRTTSFWCHPELLRSYPAYVGTSRASRYEFEHGKTSFTRHVLDLGFPCVMVTWKGSYLYGNWDKNTPDHRTILIRDQHIHEPASRMDGTAFDRMMMAR